MTVPPEALYAFQGVWSTLRADRPQTDPVAPEWGAGCEISDGYRLVITAYYDPTETPRYGGPGTYGEPGVGYGGDGSVPQGEQWVDITRFCTELALIRGSTWPTVNSTVDTVSFQIVDPDWIVHDWRPPQSFSSPQVGTPMSIGVQDPFGWFARIVTCRLSRLEDIHDIPGRVLDVQCDGVQTEANVPLLEPSFNVQDTSSDRVDEVLTAIDWPYGREAVPTVTLDADADRREGRDTWGLNILEECAHSTGNLLRFNRYGQLAFKPIIGSNVPATFTATDCLEDSTAANPVLYTGAVFSSDTDLILNDVQMVHKWNNADSCQSRDLISIGRFGVHAAGYGFPLTDIVTRDKATIQAFCDEIRDALAFIVTRVESISFDTRVDSSWWDIFAAMDLEAGVTVERTAHSEITYSGTIVGMEVTFQDGGMQGTLFLSTSEAS